MAEIPVNKKSFDASDVSSMVDQLCASIVEAIEKHHENGNYMDEKVSI